MGFIIYFGVVALHMQCATRGNCENYSPLTSFRACPPCSVAGTLSGIVGDISHSTS